MHLTRLLTLCTALGIAFSFTPTPAQAEPLRVAFMHENPVGQGGWTLSHEIAREKLKAGNSDGGAMTPKTTENLVNAARKAAFEGVNEKTSGAATTANNNAAANK